FTEQNRIPGFYFLNITAAGRYLNIEPGGSKTVPQFGVKWQPLDKQFTLRGSYSEGFTAPTIYSLFGAPSVSNPTLLLPNAGTPLGSTDPNDYQSGQVQTTTYANPNLIPATSKQWNAGIVISPDFAKGFTISVDYYNVKENNIPIADPVAASKSLNSLGSASPYAAGFSFFDGSKLATTAPNQVDVNNWGNLNYALLPGGAVKTDGLDLILSYVLPIPEPEKVGKFTLTANANWIFNYEFQNDPTLPYYQYKGQYTSGWGGSQGMIPDFSIDTALTWEIQNFTYIVSANYLPAVSDPGFLFPYVGAPVQGSTVDGATWNIPSYYTISMQLAYEFGKSKVTKDWYDGTTLRVGCNNISNHAPPLVAGAVEDNTDKNVYDIVGRFIYFELAKKF
ncbi:MAG TPA: TonB-dependent receptor, partial [Candidatus Nitrosotalea sp.]|nr:TonB-dependent receptor [Candidatus Nitrosotalea sp.]